MRVWLNGRLIEARSAHIGVTDRGFTLGDGLFETIKVSAGRARLVPLHLQRLRQGATLLGIPLHDDDAVLTDALASVISANQLSEAVLRVTLSRGPAPRGILPMAVSTPTLLIASSPLPPPALFVRSVICGSTRRNEHSPLSCIKSLNYLDSILAKMEAAQRDADEALLLNTAGSLAEASAANLFVLRDGVLSTPPVASGALPGIMRRQILALGGATEQNIDVAALYQADLVFLSNSLGLRALIELDGRKLHCNVSKLEEITEALQKRLHP